MARRVYSIVVTFLSLLRIPWRRLGSSSKPESMWLMKSRARG